MPESVQIHAADESERLQAYRNVYESWGGGLSLEDHVARRLISPQHQRAEWFVACEGGQVVSSLGCYPLQFCVEGTIHDGIAIGAVHTLPEFRGRGLAPRLIRWVEDHARNRGAAVSLLYSDIDPGYYGRLGYSTCPADEGWTNPTAANDDVASDPYEFVEFVGPNELKSLVELYTHYHTAFAVSIARSADYWRYLLSKDTADVLYWFQSPSGGRIGYVRLAGTATQWRIRDWALTGGEESSVERMFGALIREAGRNSIQRLGGWLPDCPNTRNVFSLRPRTREITMLKSLDPRVPLSPEMLPDAGHFHEIDHV